MPRLTIELSSSKHREINLLRQVGEVVTIKELMNYALTFLKWAMVERSKGNKICSVHEEGGKTVLQEIETPVLAAAARHLGFVDDLDALEAVRPMAAAAGK